SHHWARLLTGFGHEVKLIAPQLAKPHVKRGKNDAADAEALCEEQAALMLVGMRERAVAAQTQLANTIL
ncbi:IS110 family transposase, partial [Rhizobium johnstonii]